MKLSLALLGVVTADIMPSFGSGASAAVGNCPKITCVMFCKNGMQKDKNGCDICSCVRDISAGGKLATGTASCTRDANGCCADLGVAWCPDQNSCVSTRNPVIPCKSWGNNPPVTATARISTSVAQSSFSPVAQSAPQTSFTPVQSTTQASFAAQATQPAFAPMQGTTAQSGFAGLGASFSTGVGLNVATPRLNAVPPSTGVSTNTAASAGSNAAMNIPMTSLSASRLPTSNMGLGMSASLNAVNTASVNAVNTASLNTVNTASLNTGNTLSTGLASLTTANAVNAGASVGSTSRCSQVMCAMFCPNGMQKDARGCDICACAGATPNACPSTADCAGRACAGGYAKDNKGCPTCICLSGSAPAVIPSSDKVTTQPVVSASADASVQADALVSVDRPTISLNPCLPAPGPCKKSQTCVPTPKECFTTPCPQYTCVKKPKKNKGTTP